MPLEIEIFSLPTPNLWAPRPPSWPGVVNNRPTSISCSATVDRPWPNFPSPEFGTKFQSEVLVIFEVP